MGDGGGGGSGLERLQSVPNQMKKFRIVLPHVRPQEHIELMNLLQELIQNFDSITALTSQ